MFWIHCCLKYSRCSVLNNTRMKDVSLPRRYQIKLLYDRCKIITRSGSLQIVNLGHDNSCVEMLWILQGYTGFKKQVFLSWMFLINPVSCTDTTYSSGRACTVHVEGLEGCSTEVSLSYTKPSLPYQPFFMHDRVLSQVDLSYSSVVQTTLFRWSIYQIYFYPRKKN